MSEAFDSHEANEELRKEYADFILCITDLEQIDEHILNKQEDVVLARHNGIDTHFAENSVIHDAMIAYTKSSAPAGSTTGFHGYIDCAPLVPVGGQSYYWSDVVAYDLERACAANGMQVTKNQYAREELYIYSDDPSKSYYIHVRFTASHYGCRVSMETACSDGSEPVEGSALSVLEPFAHAWADAQSSIVKNFQLQSEEPTTKQTIVIGLSEQIQQPETETTEPTVERNPFDEIGGLTEAKRKLQEYATIFNNYEEAKSIGISVPHFFLHGPPGTGKTSLVHAFSDAIGAELDVVSANEVRTRYISDATSMMIDRIDNAIEKTGPQVVFLDELDVYINESASSGEYTNAAKTLGMKLELITRDHPHVILVGATNATPDSLMPALIRPGRFEAIPAPAPNQEEREQIWACHLDQIATHTILLKNGEKIPLYDQGAAISDDELNQLMSGSIVTSQQPGYSTYAALSDKMTGADIKEILHTLKRKKFITAKAIGMDMSPITSSEIEQAIQAYPRQ